MSEVEYESKIAALPKMTEGFRPLVLLSVNEEEGILKFYQWGAWRTPNPVIRRVAGEQLTHLLNDMVKTHGH